MAHYLLAVLGSGDAEEAGGYGTIQHQRDAMAKIDGFTDRLRAEGRLVYVNGLAPARTSSTVVDARGSELSVTDGPFAEIKEYMVGFWIVDAADRDAALELAAEASQACEARIEVRPTAAANIDQR